MCISIYIERYTHMYVYIYIYPILIHAVGGEYSAYAAHAIWCSREVVSRGGYRREEMRAHMSNRMWKVLYMTYPLSLYVYV